MTYHSRYHQQLRLSDFSTKTTDNIEPCGDPLLPRQDDDTFIRIAYQNIRGVSKGSNNTEIIAMHDLGIDIMGMSETNCPWNIKSKAEYDLLMRETFRTSRTLYTSAPTSTTGTYQPGGTLLTINGRTTGRMTLSGRDPWGRFCWYRLRGSRDEGILIISAYRVCHSQSHNPGPLTVYQQQYSLMRDAGITNPNPRKQLLKDIASLISIHRQDGYKPILMIDANGDYLTSSRPDVDLAQFLIDTGLSDPFYNKFSITPRTTINGTKRIDYIFTDPQLAPSILRTGYLGTHEGADSDHCLAYMDLDEATLFRGIINRPVPHHSREITLSQDDKTIAYIEALEKAFREHKMQEKVFTLADSFVRQDDTPDNVRRYHTIYTEFLDIAKSIAKRIGKKKYGYARSSELTLNGRILLVVKHMLDCKTRNAPFTPSILQRCTDLDMDPDTYWDMPTLQLRQEVRRRRKELWTSQKYCEDLRKEWLASIAKDRARACNDPNWERKLKDMIRTTKENATNRKLHMVTKGLQGTLDRIQVPTHNWFYSVKYDELYHYTDGVFEAYPSAGDNSFFSHHTLKVIAPDAELVTVTQTDDPPRWHITATLPTPTTLWTDITSQEEIEAHLLRRNKRHLEQTSREQGISTAPLLSDIRENNGINPLVMDILDGSFDTTYELSPEITQFFAALKQTPQEKTLRPILGTITSDQFQQMFKRAREKTSSDTRTLNYSLWKCIARSDFISGFAATLLSLPFSYGFVNTHWTHMSDFMLEKKPGIRQIHTLRIIGKVAAEFNTCLKFFIGHQAMHNFEASNPHDSQHGFRPNRSSVDAAMLKLLTFECSRMQRSTVGMVQHDMAAHFDRMYPAMTSIYGQKYNVDYRILRTIGDTITNLRRNVETALGLSSSTYQQEDGDPHLGGMVQGKADVPQWSTQQSDVLLRAHSHLAQGLSLRNPPGTRAIQHHSISFADDTDQHTNTNTDNPNAITEVVRDLEHSAQTWNNLISIPGGLLAYHKCNWQLIAWDSSTGYMDLLYDTDETVTINDGKGAQARIDFLPPNCPNKGLGYLLCPDGSQEPQFQATYDVLRKICGNVARAHLTESEVRHLLRTRILPKLSYTLHTTSFTHKQCSRLNTLLRTHVVPRMRLNRHYPSAVLYGPIKYGGMDFPHIHTLQTRVQVQYILKQLRWNKSVANDIIVTLDSIQLNAGLSSPILEDVAQPITYLGHSYFLSLRQRMAEIQASLWIEGIWHPQHQREGDRFLMDYFIRIPGITTAELRKANAVRLYMRVLTISDLADPTGHFIPDGMLTGEWQAGSDIYWPYQVNPPANFWAVFRRCLRQTFCTGTSPHQPIHSGMDLDTPLGLWLPVPRHTWYDVCRTRDNVYWRVDSTIRKLAPTHHPGLYVFEAEVGSIPLDAHPIIFQQVGSSIWTHRHYRMGTPHALVKSPPGLTIADTITTCPQFLLVGSDASTHLSSGISTCAWMITAGQQLIQGCCNITNVSSITSYRGELEGLYRSLLHVMSRHLAPQRMEFWCDNKAAIDKSTIGLYTPGAMVQPEADVIMAIQATCQDLQNTEYSFHHVYGHQDTRHSDNGPDEILGSPSSLSCTSFDFDTPFEDEPEQRPPQSTRAPPRLSRAARINIICDELANDTARSVAEADGPLPPTLQPPFAGSKAMFRIGNTWITSKLAHHINIAAHETRLREYCMQKYEWSASTMATISWETLHLARRGRTPTQLMHSSKLIHDWLPVMHREGRINGNKHCPGCECPDETLHHFLTCSNKLVSEKRAEALQTLGSHGTRKGAPILFMKQLVGYIAEATDTKLPTVTTRDHRMTRAFDAQDSIGPLMLLRGFVAVEWSLILKDMGTPHPQRMMAFIVRTIWDEVIQPLWSVRNNILHNNPNFTTELTHTQLGDRMLWYLQHKDYLARQDRFLARYSASCIDKMSTAIRREWIRHLDIARDAWSREQKTIDTGQTLLTQFFNRIAII